MEALFWVGCAIVIILVGMASLPSLLKKTANRGTTITVPLSAVSEPHPNPASEFDDSRRTFNRLLLLQSLLEEFKVPLSEQKMVLEPLVLKLLPSTAKKE